MHLYADDLVLWYSEEYATTAKKQNPNFSLNWIVTWAENGVLPSIDKKKPGTLFV